MDQRSGLETELLAELQGASNSTLYPSSRITTLIKDAYIWATQQYIWRDLVRGRITNTVAGEEYYDYPEDFRGDSIFRLVIDGDTYENKNFEDYLDFKTNNPTSTDKIFASFQRFYFISPTPTSTGSSNLTIWGAIQAEPLDSASTETIFSNNKESGNEAVVRKALSVAVRRSEPSLSKSEELAAKEILAELNRKEWAATHKSKRLQHPKFSVPDYFAARSIQGDPIGNFSFNP